MSGGEDPFIAEARRTNKGFGPVKPQPKAEFDFVGNGIIVALLLGVSVYLYHRFSTPGMQRTGQFMDINWYQMLHWPLGDIAAGLIVAAGMFVALKKIRFRLLGALLSGAVAFWALPSPDQLQSGWTVASAETMAIWSKVSDADDPAGDLASNAASIDDTMIVEDQHSDWLSVKVESPVYEGALPPSSKEAAPIETIRAEPQKTVVAEARPLAAEPDLSGIEPAAAPAIGFGNSVKSKLADVAPVRKPNSSDTAQALSEQEPEIIVAPVETAKVEPEARTSPAETLPQQISLEQRLAKLGMMVMADGQVIARVRIGNNWLTAEVRPDIARSSFNRFDLMRLGKSPRVGEITMIPEMVFGVAQIDGVAVKVMREPNAQNLIGTDVLDRLFSPALAENGQG